MSWLSNLFSKAKAEAVVIKNDAVADYHVVLNDVRAELPVLHSKIDTVVTQYDAQFTHVIAYVKALEAKVEALANSVKGS